MKGFELAEVRTAIVDAFDLTTFDRLLSDRLDFRRKKHVANGALEDVVEAVVERFDDEGRVPQLVAAVAAVRPAKPNIQQIYRRYAEVVLDEATRGAVQHAQFALLDSYGLLPPIAVQTGPEASSVMPLDGGFQRRVNELLPAFDPMPWVEQMLRQMRRVCRVEVDGIARATGFLVGPDVIMTNHHVLRSLISGQASGARISCLFEYWSTAGKLGSEGTRVVAREPWRDWHVASSPPSEDEDAGATVDQLDFVVVRLTRRFGEEPVVVGGAPRGWIYIPKIEANLAPGTPIAILQHPARERMKVAFDTKGVIEVNSARTRVRYLTNTAEGASGSPCFDLNWSLVALHHYGVTGAYNQGIPISTIRASLSVEAQSSLGDESP